MSTAPFHAQFRTGRAPRQDRRSKPRDSPIPHRGKMPQVAAVATFKPPLALRCLASTALDHLSHGNHGLRRARAWDRRGPGGRREQGLAWGPVWFLSGNPVVGYSVRKNDVQLLFWSGQSFDEPGLHAEGKFKAAGLRITEAGQVNLDDLNRWLQKARNIQWDYKNVVARRGVLEKLGDR